jgi:ABC-2 type transport system permease protein
MRAYLSVAKTRTIALLQYRAAALAGMVTQLAFGMIHVQIFRAFYSQSPLAHPMQLSQVVSQIWLGQAFFAMLPWRADPEMQRLFIQGEVAYEMLRPVDLYAYWFSREFAFLFAPTCLRAIPVFLFAGLFLGLAPPPSLASALATGVAMLGALLLSTTMLTTITLTRFWTLAGQGVTSMHSALFFLCSGMLAPLPLFPDFIQPLFNVLPYRALADLPFRLYTGHLPPEALPKCLALQLGWALALALIGRLLLTRATRRLVIQGG